MHPLFEAIDRQVACRTTSSAYLQVLAGSLEFKDDAEEALGSITIYLLGSRIWGVGAVQTQGVPVAPSPIIRDHKSPTDNSQR